MAPRSGPASGGDLGGDPDPVEVDHLGTPVLSNSVATTWDVLRRLDLSAEVPGCGQLLAGGV